MSERIVPITTRDLILGVAEAWRHQYSRESSGDKLEIGKRLAALDSETATAEDVVAIIGNASWTSLRCDVCQAEVDTVVRLGDKPDYDSSTLDVCAACLDRAIEALSNLRETPANGGN